MLADFYILIYWLYQINIFNSPLISFMSLVSVKIRNNFNGNYQLVYLEKNSTVHDLKNELFNIYGTNNCNIKFLNEHNINDSYKIVNDLTLFIIINDINFINHSIFNNGNVVFYKGQQYKIIKTSKKEPFFKKMIDNIKKIRSYYNVIYLTNALLLLFLFKYNLNMLYFLLLIKIITKFNKIMHTLNVLNNVSHIKKIITTLISSLIFIDHQILLQKLK